MVILLLAPACSKYIDFYILLSMKPNKTMQKLLERMARIERMERGKLCAMGERPHYNHQTWQDGKNVVRYVPAGQAEFVKEAIEGYEFFKRLAEQYVDEVVRHTRAEREREFPKKKTTNTTQKKSGPKEKSPKK
ncbi:MAG: hypothetical protein HYV26_10120 [Candidatus Hydrogenedentes bacterium]|nr:hypothetical protein [Candidatus Hydrogenedentota bacterium]